MIIPVIDAALKVIDRVIPNPEAKAAAQLELFKLQQSGELKALDADVQMAQMQADTNKVEAASDNLFVSGWRPAVGWVCVFAMGCNFIAVPLLAWASTVIDPSLPAPPRLEMAELFQLLLGMMGLGGLRTYEKIKNVARS